MPPVHRRAVKHDILKCANPACSWAPTPTPSGPTRWSVALHVRECTLPCLSDSAAPTRSPLSGGAVPIHAPADPQRDPHFLPTGLLGATSRWRLSYPRLILSTNHWTPRCPMTSESEDMGACRQWTQQPPSPTAGKWPCFGHSWSEHVKFLCGNSHPRARQGGAT